MECTEILFDNPSAAKLLRRGVKPKELTKVMSSVVSKKPLPS